VGVIGLAEGAAHLLAQSSGGAVESVAVAALPPERLATVFERVLTLEDAPILRSHVLAGRAVVPLALSAEWLAHAALHGHPGLVFMGFDDLRAVAAIAVAQGQSTAISVRAAAAQKSEGRWLVPTEIRGEDGALRVSANILLGERRLNAPQAGLRVSGTAYAGGVERAYAQVLFHGPGLRLIRSVDSLGAEGVVIDTLAAASPSEWTARPPRDQWLADPGALDAAFQAMILWTQETMGAPSLPSFAARYRQYAPFPSGGVRVVIQATSRADTASADMEFLDEDGALVARLEGYECTAHAALAQAFDKT
jgi:hypothetical protein